MIAEITSKLLTATDRLKPFCDLANATPGISVVLSDIDLPCGLLFFIATAVHAAKVHHYTLNFSA
jgi:hypothetical protein